MSVGELLGRRLVFVTGKGGVGKSTCALGLAMAAAQQGKRVLFCEFGARPASADYLGVSSVSHVPHQPLKGELPGLWVARLEPHQALQEYFRETLKVGPLVRLATENRMLSRFWKIAPSVDEIVLLNALYHYERGTHRAGPGDLDLIVVDMPATGHALSMLGVPRGILGLGRVGPLGRRCAELDALLGDREKTGYCIVTLPEELPVNESVELAEDLRTRLQLETTHVLINRVLPEALAGGERALMRQLQESVRGGTEQSIVRLAADNELLRAMQDTRIGDLKKRLAARFVEIRQHSERGRGLIERLAAQFSVGSEGAVG